MIACKSVTAFIVAKKIFNLWVQFIYEEKNYLFWVRIAGSTSHTFSNKYTTHFIGRGTFLKPFDIELLSSGKQTKQNQQQNKVKELFSGISAAEYASFMSNWVCRRKKNTAKTLN